MKQLVWSAVALLGTSAFPSYAQTDGVLLQQGIDLMETRGDCTAAMEVFERLADSGDPSVASRALLHLGRCLEPRRRDDSVGVYRRIIREYADQSEVKRLAEERLKVLAPRGAETPVLSALMQGPSAFTVIQRIRTGAEPFDAIASLDGSRIFVTNLSEPSVAVIDTETNAVVQTIELESPPEEAALALDGSRLLLAYPRRLEAIDLPSGKLTAFQVDAETIHDLAPTTDGGVYLAAGRTGLQRFDFSTGETRMVHEDPCPMALALSQNHQRLWVNYRCGGPGGRPGHDVVVEFDAGSGRLLNTISGLPNVGGMIRMSLDGKLVMAMAGDACSHPNYDHVGCERTDVGLAHVFATETRALVKSIIFSAISSPHAFRFVPQRQLVALAVGGALSFMETKNFTVVTSLSLATSGRLAFSADGARAFVPLPSEDEVAVVWLGSPSKD